MSVFTELDVVNQGLSLLGQLPVNDVLTPHPAVPSILSHLAIANKQVQARKWWFNYETTTLIPQSSDSRIQIPNDVAAVDACDRRVPVSQRGRYLYNNRDGTYTFTSPVQVKLHRIVPFSELPPSAAAYVMTQTMLRMQAGLDGDGVRYRDISASDNAALMTLSAEDIRFTQANLLDRTGVQSGLSRINQLSPYPYRR